MPFSSRPISLRSLGGKVRQEHPLTSPQGSINHFVKKSCKANFGGVTSSTTAHKAVTLTQQPQAQSLWRPVEQSNKGCLASIGSQHTATSVIITASTTNSAAALVPATTNTPLSITAPVPQESVAAIEPAILATASATAPLAIIAAAANSNTATATASATSTASTTPLAPLNTTPSASFIVTLEPVAVETSLDEPVVANNNTLNPVLNPIAIAAVLAQRNEDKAKGNRFEGNWFGRYIEKNLSKKQIVQALFMPFTRPLAEIAPTLHQQIDISHVALHQRLLFASDFLPAPDLERQKRAMQWAWLAQHGFFVHNEDPVNSDACFSLVDNKHRDIGYAEMWCPQQPTEPTAIDSIENLENTTATVTTVSSATDNSLNSLNLELLNNADANEGLYSSIFASIKSLIPDNVSLTTITSSDTGISRFNEDPLYLGYLMQPCINVCDNQRKYRLTKHPQNIKDLKNNFAFLRHRLHMRQIELCDYLHCQQSTIAKWESPFYENMWFSDHLLPVVAKVLHCDPRFLDRSNFDWATEASIKQLKLTQPRNFNNTAKIDLCRKPTTSTQISDNLNFLMCYRKRSWHQLYQDTGFNYNMMDAWRHSKLLQMDSAICWRLATFLHCPMQFLTFYRRRALPYFVVGKCK